MQSRESSEVGGNSGGQPGSVRARIKELRATIAKATDELSTLEAREKLSGAIADKPLTSIIVALAIGLIFGIAIGRSS
jgi:ElaB/YqjD/DUF883 family membrane-anchored ribosome-binding protein